MLFRHVHSFRLLGAVPVPLSLHGDVTNPARSDSWTVRSWGLAAVPTFGGTAAPSSQHLLDADCFPSSATRGQAGLRQGDAKAQGTEDLPRGPARNDEPDLHSVRQPPEPVSFYLSQAAS